MPLKRGSYCSGPPAPLVKCPCCWVDVVALVVDVSIVVTAVVSYYVLQWYVYDNLLI